MSNDNIITIVGNLTADPELRYTQNGIPVTNVTIVQSDRVLDRETNQWKDGEPTFLRASVWREFAEHVAASVRKGQRVIATGKLVQKNYRDREGNERTSFELEVHEIGPSLRFGTTQFTKAAKSDQTQQAAPASAPVAQAAPVSQPAPAQAPVHAPIQAPVAPVAQPVAAGVSAAQALGDDAF